MKASYFSMELLPLLMSIPVKFLMAISGESVNEAMEAMLDTMERDLGSRKFLFSLDGKFIFICYSTYSISGTTRNLSFCASCLGGGAGCCCLPCFRSSRTRTFLFSMQF